jgi:rubrerythrin
MNIFEQAISLKKEKINYYRQLARESSSPGVRDIFSKLAEEEENHSRMIEQMSVNAPCRTVETTILADARQIFEAMSQKQEQPAYVNAQLQLYERALRYEEEANRMYSQKAKQVSDPCQKDVFNWIANEEKKHKAVIETIINFVSKPERWLENAEWYHIETY